jgi:hypothetical protein
MTIVREGLEVVVIVDDMHEAVPVIVPIGALVGIQEVVTDVSAAQT